MSDDFDGESEIPDDLTDDIEEKIRQEVDERTGELYADTRPRRSGGCLLILALPLLSIWFW